MKKAKRGKGEARPLLRRAARGRPFSKGNTFGLSTRFKEGNRANPGGRPKSKKLSDAYRRLLESDVSDPIPVNTEAEYIARKVLHLAKRGSLPAAREIADRCEGRPALSISVHEGPDPVTVLIQEMQGMHARIAADNRPQLTDGEAQEQEATQCSE
jgi:hypothetical protein